MTSIRHTSAWGDDEELEAPPPPPEFPPPSHVEASFRKEMTDNFHDLDAPEPPKIVSGQLSYALVLALRSERPRVGGWGALAKRLGIHSSLLQRLRAGVGNISSVDDVAAKLGWRITIERPHA